MAIAVVDVSSNPADRSLTVTLMTVDGTAEGEHTNHTTCTTPTLLPHF